jgi:hypothetical protein
MTDSSEKKALWTPGWYELDQTLVLGERQKYWFFNEPPEECVKPGDDVDLVFYNQLDSSKNCVVRYARIAEMVHPQLGQLLRVDTDGLDYIFFPVEGEEIVVNAEEEPGSIYNGGQQIDDWSVLVKLTEVSETMSIPA